MVLTTSDPVAAVRAFNRFYTRVIGVLDEGLNQTSHSLTEARVLFELSRHDQLDIADLRAELGIDPGYLTRILGRLADAGLVTRARSPTDGRRQTAQLTTGGREEVAVLDARSSADVTGLLAPLSDSEQRTLLAAMETVRQLLDRAVTGRPEMKLHDAEPGDLGWVIERNGALYAAEYGWDHSYEALVARIVADFGSNHDPAEERVWIAELDGTRVGCVFCTRGDDDKTAKLRLLLVDPVARGHGVGRALVDACVDFARQRGYERMVLWTNSVLGAARRIYRAVGFELVESAPHHSFGHDLVGETWAMDLTATQ